MTESNRIEYKQELTDSLEKGAIAFLNYHDGGVIYIGIDKHGKTVGVSDADAGSWRSRIGSRTIFSPRRWGCSTSSWSAATSFR